MYVITTEDHVVKFIASHIKLEDNIIKVGGQQFYNNGYNIYENVSVAPNLRVEASCFDGETIWHNDNFLDLNAVQPLQAKIAEQQEVIDELLITILLGGAL